MQIDAIQFQLKDGREAILRSPCEADIPNMISYLVQSSGETEFLLRYPEECARYTPEIEKEILERCNTSPYQAMLVCLVDGEIAGNCMISFNDRIKTRHRAAVAIALLRNYWNLGIGTRMFEEMIRIARQQEYVTMLELDFIEGNFRARALYEKMGFRITGVRPNAIRLRDGTLLNEYMMIKEL